MARHSTHGRGLYATQALEPGAELFTERPAYYTFSEGKSDEQEGHAALAAHLVAGAASPHRKAIEELVSNVELLRKQEPRRLAVAAAVGPVRALIRSMPVDQALSIVSPASSASSSATDAMRQTIEQSLTKLAATLTEERLWLAYGRDWSNAMAVHSGTSATRRGSQLTMGPNEPSARAVTRPL